MKETNNSKSANSKCFTCTDGKYFGEGETLSLAYEDYLNRGNESFTECRFFKSEEIKVELTIK